MAEMIDYVEMYVAQCCTKPVSLFSDQKGLQMLKVGIQWFLNQTGTVFRKELNYLFKERGRN